MEHDTTVAVRQVNYLNNIVEQDHRASKRMVRAMLGSKCSGLLDTKHDTVWLTQWQMDDLFETSTDNISLHLKNVFDTDELLEDSTTEESSVVRREGNRRVIWKDTEETNSLEKAFSFSWGVLAACHHEVRMSCFFTIYAGLPPWRLPFAISGRI